MTDLQIFGIISALILIAIGGAWIVYTTLKNNGG